MRFSTRSLLLGITLLGACAGGKAAQLRMQGANDLHCPQESLVIKSMGIYIEKLSGCGQENVYYYSMEEERWISPLDRASFDLSCPKEQLHAQHIGGIQVGVLGCGRKAVYVASQSGWVINLAESMAVPGAYPLPMPPPGSAPPPPPTTPPPG